MNKEAIALLEKADSSTNWGDCCEYIKQALVKIRSAIENEEKYHADVERRLKAHSAGEAVRHFCRDCLKPFWNVDDEPMVCPHCGSKEMPIIDPDAKIIAYRDKLDELLEG